MKIVNVKDLNNAELLYLAEDLICILDCRARNDDEFNTPDDLVKDNLKKAPVLLDMIGWHDDAETLRKITLENITEFKDFLYKLEFSCLPNFDDHPNDIRYDLFSSDTIFEF